MDENQNNGMPVEPETNADNSPAKSEEKPAKKKKLLAIFGIAFAVVAIAAILLVLLLGGGKSDDGDLNDTGEGSSDVSDGNDGVEEEGGSEDDGEGDGDGDGSPVHTHTPADSVKENEVAAGCLTGGSYDEVVYCLDCDEEISREAKLLDPTGHTPSDEPTVENDIKATCVTSGSYDEVIYCVICSDELSRTHKDIGVSEHEYENGKCINCPVKVYDRESEYLYFGEYPQTVKADSVSITTTQDSRGYYLGSDGCYYAKVTATLNGKSYKFSTGKSISEGEVYYFKVEPIRWRILSEENGEALIMCDSIIESHIFHESRNNYAESDLRAWLNSTFYETAFGELQRDMILITLVDNSSGRNPYACEDTEDKIFIPSSKELNNTDYGFEKDGPYSADLAKRMQVSDYLRALGRAADMETSKQNFYGNGWWWRRTPGDSGSIVCIANNPTGQHYTRYANALLGIVPALRITLQ